MCIKKSFLFVFISILILGDGTYESITNIKKSAKSMIGLDHRNDEGAKEKELLESDTLTGTYLNPRKSVKRTFQGSFVLRYPIAPHEVLKDGLPISVQDTLQFQYQKRAAHINSHGAYDCPRVWYFGTIRTKGLD